MKPLDIILLVLFALLGVMGILYSISNETGSYVQIKTPYSEYRYSLDKDRIISVKGLLGEYQIEIKNKSVRVLSTTCPQKICQNRGSVDKVGDSIICLPNRIIIRIMGNNGEIDAVTQ